MAQQPEVVSRSTADLSGYGPSETALNGFANHAEAQIPDTNTAIGKALDSTPHYVAEQNPSQNPPNKRPRLDPHCQSAASTVANGQPLYNFVPLPEHSPSVANFAMPPPLPSTTSLRVTAGPGTVPPAYAASQAPIPRRQSSISNIGPSQQQQAQRGPTTTSLTPSTSPHSAHQATPAWPTPSMLLLPRLRAALADPVLGEAFQEECSSKRVALLQEACGSADWFYLTLHQIYCWRTMNMQVAGQLGLGGVKEIELINLEVLLMPNTSLAFTACDWFSRFPTSQESLLQGSSPEAADALCKTYLVLEKMSMHWALLQASCRARRIPPSPYELYGTLGMSSTVLQQVCFSFMFTQIEGMHDERWSNRAKQFFKFTQKQHINKLDQIRNGRSEALPSMEVAVAQFTKEYLNERRLCARRPASFRKSSNTQNNVQAPAVLASSTFVPSSSTPPATATLSPPPNQSGSPRRVSQTPNPRMVSGAHTEIARNNSYQTTPASQPAAANIVQPGIGPRQQKFVPETSGVQTAGQVSPQEFGSEVYAYSARADNFTLPGEEAQQATTQQMTAVQHNHQPQSQERNQAFPAFAAMGAANAGNAAASRRFSDFHPFPVSGIQRNPQTSSTVVRPPRPTPVIINNRLPSSSNGVSATRQISHTTQGRTPLLPRAGKLMTQNTHPNPDLLALHQVRLSTPEPTTPQVEENSQEISNLFLVFQRFALSPQKIAKEQSYYNWQIDVPDVDEFRTAVDVSVKDQTDRPAARLKRDYQRGSFVYRLRCVKLTAKLQEADWAVAPTFWPTSCFVSLNSKEIELRRKSHWGRNLPCDLTRDIKAGLNVIEVSVHFSSEEMIDTYAIAIELVEVLDHFQCTREPELIEEADSLAAVVASLNVDVSDDDIIMVDPYVSIDLIDPFTAKIWETPVRGRTCKHRECFDLDAFLYSRPNKHDRVPLSSADNWKCPHCNKDARPQSVVLDGFLLSVSTKLQAGKDEGEEVRAIRVTTDSLWEPLKTEKGAQRHGRVGQSDQCAKYPKLECEQGDCAHRSTKDVGDCD